MIRQQVHARVHPEQTLRRSLGILRLAKDFDAVRLEAPQQAELPGLSIPAHDNVRGPSYYQ